MINCCSLLTVVYFFYNYISSLVVYILTTDYQKAFCFALGHSFLAGLTFHPLPVNHGLGYRSKSSTPLKQFCLLFFYEDQLYLLFTVLWFC